MVQRCRGAVVQCAEVQRFRGSEVVQRLQARCRCEEQVQRCRLAEGVLRRLRRLRSREAEEVQRCVSFVDVHRFRVRGAEIVLRLC